MENPLEYILNAFDRVEKSNKQSVTQQQETNGSLKRVDENLGKYNRQIEATAIRMEVAGAKIPQSVTIINRKEYGINLSTKVWLSVVLFGIAFGFWFAPIAITTAETEQLRWQLRIRESEIDKFGEGNPGTAKKYFGWEREK